MSVKLRTRSQRSLGPRPRTSRARELRRALVREAEPLFDWAVRTGRWSEDGASAAPARPLTRGDCLEGPRPCPWVSCRHHLFLDVKEGGLVRFNFPNQEVEDLKETCSLDVADQGKRLSLEQVGDLVNLTRERVHLIVLQATQALRPELDDGEGEGWDA